jgi:predicted nucleotidyltransferase
MRGTGIVGAANILKERGWDVGLGWTVDGPILIFRIDGKTFEIDLTDVEDDGACMKPEKLADAVEKLLKKIN